MSSFLIQRPCLVVDTGILDTTLDQLRDIIRAENCYIILQLVQSIPASDKTVVI